MNTIPSIHFGHRIRIAKDDSNFNIKQQLNQTTKTNSNISLQNSLDSSSSDKSNDLFCSVKSLRTLNINDNTLSKEIPSDKDKIKI